MLIFAGIIKLEQLSIEFEGKDPTPQQLNVILMKARAARISKVYIQPQYNSKGARLFAQELHAEVVVLDPYSENYINSMLDIARAFSSN
jgi:zinc transport system substrate-binding protein